MSAKRHTGETKNFKMKQKHSLVFYNWFLDMTPKARATKEENQQTRLYKKVYLLQTAPHRKCKDTGQDTNFWSPSTQEARAEGSQPSLVWATEREPVSRKLRWKKKKGRGKEEEKEKREDSIHLMEWETLHSNHVFDKGLVLRINNVHSTIARFRTTQWCPWAINVAPRKMHE